MAVKIPKVVATTLNIGVKAKVDYGNFQTEYVLKFGH